MTRSQLLRGVDLVQDFDPSLSITDVISSLIMAQKEEDAFFICNLSDIYRQHKRWKAFLPRVKPFYAVKCNPSPFLLRFLSNLGTGFDCASAAEIDQILAMGVSPQSIIYAHPCKPISQVCHARDVGVDLTVFDNCNELKKIKAHQPNARLLLRIIADDSGASCPLSKKFGATTSACPSLLAMAAELGLSVVGVCFHVGSGQTQVAPFLKTVVVAHAVFEAGKKLGHDMKILNIGGGFSGDMDSGDGSIPSFEDIARPMGQLIDELFDDDVTVIAEPGRFYVAASHTLVTNIIARRDIDNSRNYPPPGPEPVPGPIGMVELDDIFSDMGSTDVSEETIVETSIITHDSALPPDDIKYMYYINDGVYGAFNCIFFDHVQCFPTVLGKSGPASPSKIFGPTCDALDCICQHVMMPKMEIGEWLYWQDMGAYTNAASTRFNGFGECDTIVIWK